MTTEGRWLEVVLQRSQRERCVSRVRSVLIEPGAAVGSNYSSELLRLRADCVLGSGRSEGRTLVLKRLPAAADQRNFIARHRLFRVEIEIYENVLKQMAPLMRTFDFGEEFWPEMFTTEGEEVILLEDLKCAGYGTVAGRQLSEAELLLVVRALARFHGMSRWLVQQGRFQPDLYRRNNMVQSDCIVDFVFLSTLRAIHSSFATSPSPRSDELMEQIERLLPRVGPALERLHLQTQGQLDVLNHGDCWLNNLLFKAAHCSPVYTHLKMIDFQMCHYNWYAWDLVQLVYCSLHPGTRDRLKAGVLAVYQATLEETLGALGAGPCPRPGEVAAAFDSLELSGLLYSLATQPRLLPAEYDLDLEITDALTATAKRTELYSSPRVLGLVMPDLVRLCNLEINV